MTKLWEELVRLISLYFLAIAGNEIPTILVEVSLHFCVHFCVVDVFWNKVR